jgi:acyl carrier protein
MAESNPGVLTFEEFRDIIARELMVAKEKVIPDASFIEDLLVDSIRMVETMLKLEDMGMSIPLEAAWSIETVRDAYQQYCQQYEVAQEGTESARPAPAPAGGD